MSDAIGAVADGGAATCPSQTRLHACRHANDGGKRVRILQKTMQNE